MNLLPPLIPLITFFIFWGIFYKLQSNWRSSFLSAAIAWGTLLTAITEVLSLYRAISFWPILGAWCLCFVAAIFGWIKTIGNPKELIQEFKIPNLSRFELLLLGGIGFIVLAVGLIAWVAPPNTWDSMTYHMARVMHWIQDRSVAYYPTHISRQLYLNPGSEFIILHFQILSGGDHLANAVQWFSMVGSAIGISLITKQFGADSRGQIFSAIISLTIPMGILQGSSTQNDYAVAFWLVCFAYYVLALKTNGSLWMSLGIGASLGLASLTKATTYIFAAPFLVWLSMRLLKTDFLRNLRLLSIAAAVFLLFNLGYYLRNYELFRSPLGPSEEIFSTGGQTQYFKFANEIFSIPVLISNSVRNIAINTGTPFNPVNQLMQQGVDLIHTSIGLSPSDPRTTWPGAQFEILAPSFLEDSAGNLQTVLLIAVAIILLASQRATKQKAVIYTLCLVLAFLLFSFYLKWQPWNSRLELPLFVLWSAVIGITLANLHRKWIADTIIVLSLVTALPWVFLNFSRPLVGSQNIFNTNRTELYFRNQHSLWFTYSRVTQYLGYLQCKQIGLYFEGGSWEYPLWVLLQQELGKDIQIESVNVENISSKEYVNFPEFTPCVVLVANPLPVNDFIVNNTSYSISLSTKYISILMPK